jgi:hypothetical protein
MPQAPEHLVFELVDALDEFASRQRELLAQLRAFRGHVPGLDRAPAGEQPLAHSVVAQHPKEPELMGSRGPPPTTSSFSYFPTGPPTDAALHKELRGSSHAVGPTPAVRATKRDYDYFAALDADLARLRATGQARTLSDTGPEAAEPPLTVHD